MDGTLYVTVSLRTVATDAEVNFCQTEHYILARNAHVDGPTLHAFALLDHLPARTHHPYSAQPHLVRVRHRSSFGHADPSFPRLSKMIRALRKRFDSEDGLDKQPLLGSATGIQIQAPLPQPNPASTGVDIRAPSPLAAGPPQNGASSPPRNYTTTEPTEGAA